MDGSSRERMAKYYFRNAVLKSQVPDAIFLSRATMGLFS